MRNVIIFAVVILGAVAGGLAIGFLTAERPQVALENAGPQTPQVTSPFPDPVAGEPGAEDASETEAASGDVERRPAPDPTPSSPLLEASETALANDELALLFHFDLKVLAQVERAYFGTSDLDALPPPLLDPHNLRQRLAAQGIDLEDALDHVVAGLFTRGEEIGGAAMLLGRIPTERLQHVLAQVYQVERRQSPHGELFLITHRDERTCDLKGPMALFLASEHILVGTPWVVESILPRMGAASPAERNLTAWRRLRAGKVFSFATLAAPEELARSLAQDPMSGALLSSSEGDLPHIMSLSGGLTLDALPLKANLTLNVASDNDLWARDQAAAFRAGKDALRRDYGSDLPALSRLSERLSLTADETQIAISLHLDESTVEEIGDLFGEVIKAAFMGMGGGLMQTPPENGVPSEQLADPNRLTRYRSSASHADLPSFSGLEDRTMEPETESGPFGLKIAAARLSEDAPEFLEIVVEAASASLPNLPQDEFHALEGRPTASLVITGASDAEGRNLLRQEDCGADRNGEPAALQLRDHSVYSGSTWKTERRVAGQKSLRLAPGTELDDVRRIDGEIRFNLASTTETHQLSAPLAGQVIESHGIRIQLRESEAGGVAYSVSGESDRLLAVRGLNRDGAALASAGTASSGSFGGFEKRIERQFQGEVHSAQFVIASELTMRSYPFALTSALPRFSEWDFPEPHEVPTVRPAELTGLTLPDKGCDDSLASAIANPFRFCLKQVSHFFGPHYQIGVTTMGPELNAIVGNESGAEIRLDRLHLADGREIEIEAGAFAELRWNSYDKVSEAQNYITLELPEQIDSEAITAVEGRLLVRLPTALERMELESTRPGSVVTGADGNSMRLLGFENGNLQLELTGARNRLVQFRAHRANNGVAATMTHNLDDGASNGSTAWHATVATSGRPAAIEAVFASEQEILEFPFELRR